MLEELERLDNDDTPETDLSDEKTEDMGVARRSGDEFEDVLSSGVVTTSNSSVDIVQDDIGMTLAVAIKQYTSQAVSMLEGISTRLGTKMWLHERDRGNLDHTVKIEVR